MPFWGQFKARIVGGMKTSILIVLAYFAVSSATFGVVCVSAQTPTPTPPAKVNARPRSTPVIDAEPYDGADVATMASKCVTLDTEVGKIEIELFPESAPESVRNFLNLVALGDLDTTTFSRVVPGFVIQGGNLLTRSGGVPADVARRSRRTIPDEPSKILHERGIVSMARSDTPNSATTEFFILVRTEKHLDGTFSAFGRVTRGMNVVDAINRGTVNDEKPMRPVKIKTATIGACTRAN
jgi:peptidyl-prolyl cis-trans isomerase B (cyclophilin B)